MTTGNGKITPNAPGSTRTSPAGQHGPRPLWTRQRANGRVWLAFTGLALTAMAAWWLSAASRSRDQAPDAQSPPPATPNAPVATPEAPVAPIRAATQPVMRGRWVSEVAEVTAYCPCYQCCGKRPGDPGYGITASGQPVTANGGHFVAADSMVPYGTVVVIPGYNFGRPVPVLDRGGAIVGDRIDVFFPSHSQALRWGRQKIVVYIWQEAKP